MPSGDNHPRFPIYRGNSQALGQGNCSPWTCYAAENLQFVSSSTPAHASNLLPFRIDTGAFVSAFPESWLHNPRLNLRNCLPSLSSPVTVQTIAGNAVGRLAHDVAVTFPNVKGGPYLFDFLVTPGLNDRNYGLISLREVAGYFAIATEGRLVVQPTGEPSDLLEIVLVPIASGSERAR